MNLDLFDNMDGLVLRERESTLSKQSGNTVSDNTGRMSRFPQNTPLAMAYVPYQEWGEVYDEDSAFSRGTLFPELDLPFEAGGADQ